MKSKSYMLIASLIFLNVITLVSAEEAKPALDLVYLLVEQTFGGILITAVGMILMFALIGMWSRMSPSTIMYFCLLFAATFAIGWIGGVAAFGFGVIAIFYLWNGWKNWSNSGGGS